MVGGGDSAVETALALAEQPGNEVTLSYRRTEFTRVRSKNLSRLEAGIEGGRIDVIRGSELREIRPDSVELSVGETTRALPNDDVFIMAGGIPPFELLENSGVSFDPALREPPKPVIEQGTGWVNEYYLAEQPLAVEQFDLDELGIADLADCLPLNGHFVHVLGVDDQVLAVLQFQYLADDDTAVPELYFGRRGRNEDEAEGQ